MCNHCGRVCAAVAAIRAVRRRLVASASVWASIYQPHPGQASHAPSEKRPGRAPSGRLDIALLSLSSPFCSSAAGL